MIYINTTIQIINLQTLHPLLYCLVIDSTGGWNIAQYAIYLRDAVDGHGINNQRTYHNQAICISKNGVCADTLADPLGMPPGPPQRSKVTSNGTAIFQLNGRQPNHYFYWNPAAPLASGANSYHPPTSPPNNFWVEIVF